MKLILSKIVNKEGQNSDKMLGTVLLAYRAIPNACINFFTFLLVYGRTPSLPTVLGFRNQIYRFPV